MGIVFRCKDQRMNKEVAVKVVAWNYSDADIIRFQREAKALASLQHPNILSAFDFGTSENGCLYLAMDLLKGKDLSDILDDRKIPIEEAVEIFLQICDGLSHAHNNGILHRDMKPSNIFVEYRKNDLIVTITDFGLAKLLSEDSQLTAAGVSIGSPPYMSPEQANAKPATIRSDIYSVGCLMFETLTGEPPFLGSGIPQTLIMHMNNPAPRLSDRTPGYKFPEQLENIVDICLKKNPAERYQTMAELKKALLQFRDSQMPSSSAESIITESQVNRIQNAKMFSTTSLATPAAESPPPKKVAKGFTWPMVLMIVAAIGCLGFAYFLATQLMAPEPGSEKKPTPLSTDVDGETVAGKTFQEANWAVINGSGAGKKVRELTEGIEYLDLSDSDIADDDLTSLPESTKGLKLSRTDISDKALNSISELPNIEDLDFKFCKKLSDSGVLSLSKLKHLRRLTLTDTPVTDESITELKLPALEDLLLNDCSQITGENFDKLAINFPNLQNLNLGKSGFQSTNIAKLGSINLAMLDVSSLNLNNDDIQNYVSNLTGTRLIKLRICHNPEIRGKGLYAISHIKQLEAIDVTGCTGLSAAALRKFRETNPTCFPIRQSETGETVIQPGEDVQ